MRAACCHDLQLHAESGLSGDCSQQPRWDEIQHGRIMLGAHTHAAIARARDVLGRRRLRAAASGDLNSKKGEGRQAQEEDAPQPRQGHGERLEAGSQATQPSGTRFSFSFPGRGRARSQETHQDQSRKPVLWLQRALLGLGALGLGFGHLATWTRRFAKSSCATSTN